MMITPQQESEPVNPLARFVTPEAIALLLNIKVEQIKDIRLWRYVILVIAQGKTRFVSYADLPPIIEAEPPKTQDFLCWRKRWKKSETKKAPDFWFKFYQQKFMQAVCVAQLHTWGQLIRLTDSTEFPIPLKGWGWIVGELGGTSAQGCPNNFQMFRNILTANCI